jgi:hypothetical protein
MLRGLNHALFKFISSLCSEELDPYFSNILCGEPIHPRLKLLIDPFERQKIGFSLLSCAIPHFYCQEALSARFLQKFGDPVQLMDSSSLAEVGGKIELFIFNCIYGFAFNAQVVPGLCRIYQDV